MRSIWNIKVEELLEQTASASPTPGGGSVAVVTGGLGLALVAMALEVRLRKMGQNQALAKLLGQTRARLKNLRQFADQDIEAYQNFVSALSLPKNSDDQKEARSQALANAALNATNVPLRSAREMLSGLEIASAAAGLVEGAIASDVAAGAILLAASLQAVLLNVDVNLSNLKDEVFKEKALAEKESLLAKAQAIIKTVLHKTKTA